ncbi:MAG: hypothetical protein M1118_11740 [Chloroflexi bacterium]|nr:hypothetical protein [Chloroflexota bacterium]
MPDTAYDPACSASRPDRARALVIQHPELVAAVWVCALPRCGKTQAAIHLTKRTWGVQIRTLLSPYTKGVDVEVQGAPARGDTLVLERQEQRRSVWRRRFGLGLILRQTEGRLQRVLG